MSQKIISIAIVVVVVITIALGYWFYKTGNMSLGQGSEVLKDATTFDQNQLATSSSAVAKSEILKTYRSEKWGMEFKYSADFVLNTTPSDFWKNYPGYNRGQDFFELVNIEKGCYIGPVKPVGFEGSSSKITSEKKSISANNQKLEVVYYFVEGDLVSGGVELPTSLTSDEGTYLTINLSSLSDPQIESRYKTTAADYSIDSGCVKDFEQIISTFKFID